jgi:enamine deaminase RidA (YjgF/YER057c/UK114 family)
MTFGPTPIRIEGDPLARHPADTAREVKRLTLPELMVEIAVIAAL